MLYLFAKQILFLVLFISFGYVIGKAFLKSFSFSSISEACAFSIAVGWGIIALLMTSFGFLGWLRFFILFPILIIVFVVSLLAIIQNSHFKFNYLFFSFKNHLSDPFFIRIIKFTSSTLLFFILLYFILLFYLTAYPVTEWDAVMYHLPVAKEFVAQGKISVVPFVRFPVLPESIELFFGLALMLRDPLFANLTQYAMAIVLVLLIYAFARRYLNREIGLFSAFVFITSPIASKLSAIPYVEIGATLFCFAAFYAWYIWLTEGKLRFGLLSAIFWGLAFGSKYYAILFFLITFLVTIIIFSRKVKFRHIIPLIFLSAFIAFPWYYRNKIYSGDWFFPIFYSTGIWSPTDVSQHLNYLCSFGLSKDIRSLFMLPINLLYHSERFQENIGPFMLICTGSLMFVKKWSRFISAFAMIVFGYTFFWFYNFQVLRFLFPMFPILSLLGGWTLKNVNRYLSIKKQWFWYFWITAMLLFGCLNCIKIIKYNGPIPVTKNEKFEYISQRIPTYKAIHFLNNIEQQDLVVYALFDEGSVYYHTNKVIGDWYGPAAYRYVLHDINNPALMHKTLTSYEAKYLLINKRRMFALRNFLMQQERIDVDDISNLFKNSLFDLSYSDQNAFVFEIL